MRRTGKNKNDTRKWLALGPQASGVKLEVMGSVVLHGLLSVGLQSPLAALIAGPCQRTTET